MSAMDRVAVKPGAAGGRRLGSGMERGQKSGALSGQDLEYTESGSRWNPGAHGATRNDTKKLRGWRQGW